MMEKKLKSAIGVLVLLGLPFLGGCGKNSNAPLSPLYNPPTLFSTFDDGTTGNWVFDYSSPFALTSPPALSVETQTVFGGTDALQMPIPNQVVTGGVTYALTAYSIHTTFSSPVTVDMTNRVLSMWVYWESGLVTGPNKVGAQLFIKAANNWHYANGTLVDLVPNHWVQVLFNVNNPAYSDAIPPDPSIVIQAGLQIAGAGSSVFSTPGVIYADSFGF